MRFIIAIAALMCVQGCDQVQTKSAAHNESAVVSLPPLAEGEAHLTVICTTGVLEPPIQYALIENVPGDPHADAVNETVLAIREQWIQHMRLQGRTIEIDGALAPRCVARRPEDIPGEVDLLQAAAQHNGGVQQVEWRPGA